MTLVTLVATRHISLTVLVMLANFLLLKQGLNAATRPESTKAQALRNLLISVASVVCLVAAAGVLQLISPRGIEVVGDASTADDACRGTGLCLSCRDTIDSTGARQNVP